MINSVRPIVTPDDVKGLKIRIPPGPVTEGMIRALGGSPTAISATELYSSFQTHLIDGMEFPINAVEAYKVYEVSKYVSYTNHQWTGYTVLANAEYWQKLPKNIQDIAEKSFNEEGVIECYDVPKLDAGVEAKLKTQGMVFNNVKSQKAFQEVLSKAGLYSQWRDLFGAQAWALLERSVGKLA
jgi:TRAP-type C4-dicarboxylate transport system substrate-binding protein